MKEGSPNADRYSTKENTPVSIQKKSIKRRSSTTNHKKSPTYDD